MKPKVDQRAVLRSSVFRLAVVFVVGSLTAGTASGLPVTDTYTRGDSTALGTTEAGGVSYEEFNASGGLLAPDDVARIDSLRIRFAGGSLYGNPTDPAEARLSGIGFDLDVTAEVRFLADGYDPGGVANAALYTFRQGMDFESVFTKGAVHLVILPNGTYIIQVVTASGASGNFFQVPFPTILVPVNLAPIGTPFLLADTNGNGILESDEPFTLRAKIVGDVFCWFMNGVQIGQPLILPDEAITGVSTTAASNFIFGRTRARSQGDPLEVAFDDLSIQAPDQSCAPPVEVSIDIKPGSDPNSINPGSNGVIPVAILTTETFDASTVDPSTVEFGPSGAAPVHSALEDVDGDGDLDLILHFRTQATGIACGDTQAALTGATTGGQAFEGADAVNTVGCQ